MLRLFLGKPASPAPRGSKRPPLQFEKGVISHKPISKRSKGCPPHTEGRLSSTQVSSGAQEEEIQSHVLSTHQILRPIPTVSKGLLKQASTIMAFQGTLLRERTGADYKGPH